jgi:hypothetical protein|tara:strand:+ start:271 stop:474 length:204 start_codon:yes stop_codon:yes gene_type:complete
MEFPQPQVAFGKLDNKRLLLELQDDIRKLKEDSKLIQINLKIIIAKLEAKQTPEQKVKEAISKGWWG